MNMTQIYYLLSVSETHSLHKSAEKCNISPQGMSKAIRSLEEELGVALIERSTKGAYLTEIGDSLLGEFEAISRLYKGITAQCDVLNKVTKVREITGEVKLAVTTRFADTYISKIIGKFREKYPKIAVLVETYDNFRVLEEMSKNNAAVDLGILAIIDSGFLDFDMRQHLENYNVSHEVFSTQPMYQIGTVKTIQTINERLARGEYIDELPMVSYRYSEETSYDMQYQVNSIALQKDMITSQGAVGAYTMDDIEMHFNKNKYAYISFGNELIMNYAYLETKDKQLTQAEECFIEFLKDYFSPKK